MKLIFNMPKQWLSRSLLIVTLMAAPLMVPSGVVAAGMNPMFMAWMMMDAMMQMMNWMVGRNGGYNNYLPNQWGGGGLPSGQLNQLAQLQQLNQLSQLSQLGQAGQAGVLAAPLSGLTNSQPSLGVNPFNTQSPLSMLGIERNIAPTTTTTVTNAAAYGYVGIEGIWSAPGGEYWAVRGNRFIFYNGSGTNARGEYVVNNDWIIAQTYPDAGESSVKIELQFRQMDNLLLLRNRQGQVTLLHRQYDPNTVSQGGSLPLPTPNFSLK
ncbi:MAG: hypothetical protein HQL49_03725 [Gammaproteobacteria bacterium]|nr:hypothetical protein [Gammaproteobacteria bacterium]